MSFKVSFDHTDKDFPIENRKISVEDPDSADDLTVGFKIDFQQNQSNFSPKTDLSIVETKNINELKQTEIIEMYGGSASSVMR